MLPDSKLRNLFAPALKIARNAIPSRFVFFAIILFASYAYSHPATAGAAEDTVAPAVSMTAPAAGAFVSGSAVTISATASDNIGVVGVQFRLDGTNLGAEDTAAPYSISWNAAAASNGQHTLTAVARDAAGNQATSTPITVTKDTTAPLVSLTAPSAGATVSGSAVTVSATATDNIGVVGVQFRLDGANLGAEDTAAPYSIAWNATAAANGQHTLTAVARDAAGNQATSSPITVTKITPDTTAPAVSMTAPAAGATVSGSAVTVSATATDNIGVVGVQFRLDGANLGAEDTAAPYSIAWNATAASNGQHTLTAVARDAAGNQATSSPITVTKITPDTTAPAVSMTAPAAGATVSGSAVTVSATATDNIGVVGVQFRLDGANLGAEDTAAPYSIAWNATAAANGQHTLTAVARDAAGNQATSSPITVTKITPDTTAPAVSMTAPAAGAFVSGSDVTIAATATDNIGVVGVQFRLDGANLGAEDTAAPYSISWNAAAAADGQHTLTAVARDAAGNQATSTAITVTKITPDTTAPAVSMTAPAAGATVSGSAVTVSATATDNIGVVGVQFRLDGANLGAEDTAAPYSISWNAAAAADGQHTLTAVARDAAGNQATSSPIMVTKITPDTTAPAVSMTAPAAGATVSGSAVTVSATATDNIGVVGVQFRLDGTDLGAEDTAAPYSIAWNAAAAADGQHTLTAVARDAAGNQATSTPITVTKDTTAPAVSMTAPAASAFVSGSAVTISATATDNIGVVGVQFRLDGTNLGAEDTTAPYSISWNAAAAADGQHILTAVARDAAGNQATSTPITVTKDTTAPAVSMTAPVGGATVSGSAVTISATATDNIGVVGVQFRLDGAILGAEDTVAPYSIAWNATAASNGQHTLTAVARDAAGNQATSSAITVTKITADTTAPAVSMTAPAAGAFVSGSAVTISATATDNIGVVGVQFRLDGLNLGAEDTAAPYSISWNAAAAADGQHTLTAVARDAAGNQATSTPITVTKDTTAPAVSMTAPAAGATVSGSAVTISATATDNIGVVGVQFRLDGAILGAEDTVAPYSIAWNAAAAANGQHTLTAVARDAAGNQATSSAITVTKITADTTAPAVSMTTPAAGATVSGSAVTVSATATDNIGVVGVQFRLDGTNLSAEDTAAPYSISWNAAAAADGQHTLTAVARDAAGNQATSTAITVTKVTPDTTAPAVSMTAPAAGATVSGSAVTVSVTATDNIGVVGVQFRLDGANLGAEDTAAPYSIAWNASSSPDGQHTLTAVARDAAGNQATSAPITVMKVTTGPSMTDPSSGAMGGASLKYVRVKPDTAAAPSVGVVTLAYRDASTIVSETTLPSSAPVQSGRIYVDLTSSVKTGIALVNTSGQDATISFDFTNAGGTQIRSGVYALPSQQQVAAFLDTAPFSAPMPMQGTFTFTSSISIYAVAVRGFTNERGDFLMANVPVSPLNPQAGRVAMFPDVVDRGNGQDSVILVNHTANTLSGSVQFFGNPNSTGNTVPVNVNGGPNSTIPYSLSPHGEVTIRLQGASDTANVGSARITPSAGTGTPEGFSLFSYKSSQGVTVSETMLPSVTPGQAFRLSVETSKGISEVESIRTSVALFNPSTSAVTVQLELHDFSGAQVGPVGTINLPAGGQLSRAVNYFLPQMPVEFKGVLRMTASGPLIAAGLRRILNGRAEILVTAMPVWNESILPGGGESDFAYVLNGGGYNPTFVVISPTPASGSAGKLSLVNTDGSITDMLQNIP